MPLPRLLQQILVLVCAALLPLHFAHSTQLTACRLSGFIAMEDLVSTPPPQTKRLGGDESPGQLDGPLDSTGKIPIRTLSARRAEATSTLKAAELQRQYEEELRWHRKQADHLKMEFDTQKARKRELEDLVDRLKQELQTAKLAQAEVEELRQKVGGERSNKEVEQLRAELSNLQVHKEKLESDLKSAGEVHQATTKELAEVYKQHSTVQSSHEALQKQVEELQALNNSLSDQLSQSQAALSTAHAQNAGLMQQMSQASAELSKKSSECEALQQQVGELGVEAEIKAALQNEMQEMQHQVTNYKDALRCLEEQAASKDQEVVLLKEAAATQAVAVAHKEALERSQREHAELKSEYARAVYEMAKAKAEHSEMAGKLAKSLAEKDQLKQRLCALQVAHTEVELAAKLALDDVDAVMQGDQDGLKPGGTASSNGVAPASDREEQGGAVRGVAISGGGQSTCSEDGGLLRAVGVAKQQLERVRKLAGDAMNAADKRVLERAAGATPSAAALSTTLTGPA